MASALLDRIIVPELEKALARDLRRAATSAVLLAGDIAAYLLAGFVILLLIPEPIERVELQRAFAFAGSAAIILHASSGLYPGYRTHNHEALRRRTVASFRVAAMSAGATLLLSHGKPLLLPIIGFLALGLLLQPLVCWCARSLCRRFGIWGERAVILGRPEQAAALAAYFNAHWQYGIRPEPRQTTTDPSQKDRPCLALIADDNGSFLRDLAAIRLNYPEVILLSDTPSIKVSGLQPSDVGGQIGVCLAGERSVGVPALARRVLDLAIAVPALLMVMPFLLMAAGLIYLIDPGPVLFVQKREGIGGKTVQILKLRTMYQDAEQRLDALFRDDPSRRNEWSTHFKLKQDPRILPVIGQVLRSTSFDELPQLVNVIAGHMAIVGPRPFPEYHLLAMDRAFRDKRRSVMPGLTGLWQISARSSADLKLQQQLDEFYIDNRSFWFDWHILLSTAHAVFKRNGAY